MRKICHLISLHDLLRPLHLYPFCSCTIASNVITQHCHHILLRVFLFAIELYISIFPKRTTLNHKVRVVVFVLPNNAFTFATIHEIHPEFIRFRFGDFKVIF
eukprot:385339_1